MGRSLVERLAFLPEDARAVVLAGISAEEQLELLESWPATARPEQLPPEGDWDVWMILAGRGFGKTRAGAEWVTAMADDYPGCRIALVGTTSHDVESVMLEGESGLLAVAGEDFEPEYKVGRRQLLWPNGSMATLFSAVEPDQLRGPQFHFGWCDELAAWPQPRAVWDNLRMAMRLGERPRLMVTTTPRPAQILRELLEMPGVTVTRGTTYDNRLNLPPAFLRGLTADYAGTALGRQELLGELLEAREGALWSRDGLERCRVAAAPALERVVVGVDPPAGAGGCGIVVAGLGVDGLAYVLADASLEGARAEVWAAAVRAAHARHGAGLVVAEVNNGGDMVVAMLKATGHALAVKDVRASRGKAARAEPVAALYATGRVRHVGMFAALEDQMCGLVLGGGYAGPGSSPDRADALVWALTELMLGAGGRPQVRSIR